MSIDSFDKHANFSFENIDTKEKTNYVYHDEKEKVKQSLVVKRSEGFSGREYQVNLFSQGIKKVPGKYKVRVKIKNISSNIVEFKITK